VTTTLVALATATRSSSYLSYLNFPARNMRSSHHEVEKFRDVFIITSAMAVMLNKLCGW
jgi:hypothetical protein